MCFMSVVTAQPFFDPMILQKLTKQEVKVYQDVVDAAAEFDKVTGQPDCTGNPEKEKVLEVLRKRAVELEAQVAQEQAFDKEELELRRKINELENKLLTLQARKTILEIKEESKKSGSLEIPRTGSIFDPNMILTGTSIPYNDGVFGPITGNSFSINQNEMSQLIADGKIHYTS